MKKILILLSLTLISWGAFAQHEHVKMNHAENGRSKMQSKTAVKSTVLSPVKVERSEAVTAIITNYLALKDAFVEDNSRKAADYGKRLFDAFKKFDISTQSKAQQKELTDIIEDAAEHAEHISKNSGNIEHQREHFETLSTDLKDLIVITGSDRNLYQIYCPMYNKPDGATWLSSSEVINNPYLGNKMMKCGSIKHEIKIK